MKSKGELMKYFIYWNILLVVYSSHLQQIPHYLLDPQVRVVERTHCQMRLGLVSIPVLLYPNPLPSTSISRHKSFKMNGKEDDEWFKGKNINGKLRWRGAEMHILYTHNHMLSQIQTVKIMAIFNFLLLIILSHTLHIHIHIIKRKSNAWMRMRG